MRFVTPLVLALLAGSAHAATDEAQLIAQINAYRAQAPVCEGKVLDAPAPLANDLRLAEPTTTDIGQLQKALGESGYTAARLQLLRLSGPQSVEQAMAALSQRFCKQLLAPQFVDIGVARSAGNWRVVLARPLLSSGLGDWQEEGQRLLAAVNRARGQARRCGDRELPAAGPLAWSVELAEAALAHSRDMANGNFFSHRGSDGGQVDERALRAGYGWSRLGENIAAGQDSAQAVVDGWLASPEHCRNLMSAGFSESAAAYAVDPGSDAGIYWTQVYAAP